jgi:hypothetical protein
MAINQAAPVEGSDYTLGRGEIKVPTFQSIRDYFFEDRVETDYFFTDSHVLNFFRKLWVLNGTEHSPDLNPEDAKELFLPAGGQRKPQVMVRARQYYQRVGEEYSIDVLPSGGKVAPAKNMVQVSYVPNGSNANLFSREGRGQKALNDPFRIYFEGKNLTWFGFRPDSVEGDSPIKTTTEHWSSALKSMLEQTIEFLHP